MIFKGLLTTEKKTTEMPIHTCTASPDIFDAVWTFIPHEVIDFSKFMTIRSLVIECYGPDYADPPTARTPWCLLGCRVPQTNISCSGHINLFECFTSPHLYPDNEPFTLPTLRMFPLLENIIIQNTYHGSPTIAPVYLKSLTDIPNNLRTLEIHNSLIEDIGSIVTQCPSLVTLRLQNNKFPIKIHSYPSTLHALYVVGETITHDMNISKDTAIISLIHSNIPYIYIDPSILYSNVFRHERLIVAGCASPYDECILSNNQIKFLPKVQHIVYTNSTHIYRHFGSIPSRIRINDLDADRENPIIVALKGLQSNYPRRMAEFIA